jgi:hypothetical protein
MPWHGSLPPALTLSRYIIFQFVWTRAAQCGPPLPPALTRSRPAADCCGLPGADARLARHLQRWGGCERRAGGCGCRACPSARSPPTQIRRAHVRTCLSAQARAHGSRSFNLKLLVSMRLCPSVSVSTRIRVRATRRAVPCAPWPANPSLGRDASTVPPLGSP